MATLKVLKIDAKSKWSTWWDQTITVEVVPGWLGRLFGMKSRILTYFSTHGVYFDCLETYSRISFMSIRGSKLRSIFGMAPLIAQQLDQQKYQQKEEEHRLAEEKILHSNRERSRFESLVE